MKTATIQELKQALQQSSITELTDLCLRLARFKKENKELLTYLLFEANDTTAYIKNVKEEIDKELETMNKTSVYFAKKTLRKVLRITNKFIRYSNNDTVAIELLLYYCLAIKDLGTTFTQNPVINNLYQNQLKKIKKTLATLHEEEQYDYIKMLDNL
jgi:hypothetical protein